MTQVARDKIKRLLSEWTCDLRNLFYHYEIKAINFGVQRVGEGYELYLTGHSWFDEYDLWLLDEKWSPSKNYVLLRQDLVNVERTDFLEEYEHFVEEEIENSKDIYKNLIIVVGMVDGKYRRLK